MNPQNPLQMDDNALMQDYLWIKSFLHNFGSVTVNHLSSHPFERKISEIVRVDTYRVFISTWVKPI